MSGRGPVPAETRRRANEPARGDWQHAAGVGWQHGAIPPCPVESEAAQETWRIWFGAWFAAYWEPIDIPVLRIVIKLWDKADTNTATGSQRTELRQLMDDLGITRKGRQDRRWKPPADAEAPAVKKARVDPYARLRAV